MIAYTDEIWKDIEGYEGKYQISNKGNVKSLNYCNTGKPRLLKPKINRYGYAEVKLSKNNKTKNYLISTLVAKTFIANKNEDKEVMHIGDTSDNSIYNLKYGYRSEILHLMYKKGHRGEATPSVYKISFAGKQYRSISNIAKDYNMTRKQLSHRLERGWTLKEALEIPLHRDERILHVKLYNCYGKLLSVKQLEKIFGIDRKNIYRRLKEGWSVEEAVECPKLIRRKGKNKNES